MPFTAAQLQEGIAFLQANAATLPPQFVADRTADLQSQLQALGVNPNAPMDAAAAGGAAPTGAPSGAVTAGVATPAPQATVPAGQPSTIDEAIARFQAGQMSFGQLLQFVTVSNVQNHVPNPQQQAAGFLQGLGIVSPGATVASVGGANAGGGGGLAGGAGAGGGGGGGGGGAVPTIGQRRPSPTVPGGFEVFQNGQWVPISGGGTAPAGQAAPSGAPPGWPPGIRFPPRRSVRVVDPITQEVRFEPTNEVDGEAIRDIMQAFGIGGFAPRPGGVDALVARALSDGNFDLARQLVNASRGGTGFQPSETTQQQLDRALQNALANGNFDEVRRLRALLSEPTGFQAQQEADRARAAQQAFSFGERQEFRTGERARLENQLAMARDQREADAARSELARLDAQESRAASAFPLTEQLRRNQDTRAAAEQAFGQGLQNRQFGLQEQGQAFGQGLASSQEARAAQAQAFGQGQARLQAGLSILRSPGDQFLFQTRLRGNQPNQPFQLGGTAISRNAFLGPFGQQAFGGGQGQPQQTPTGAAFPQNEAQRLSQASGTPVTIDPSFVQSNASFLRPFGGGQGQAGQQFGSLLQPEGGQPPTAPFGIGSGLQQAFAGQQIDRPRQLTSLGAPPFLNLQQQRNLLPSEREMHQAEVQAQGFFLPDFEEQQRRQNPRAFRTSPQAFRTAARPRAF